MWLPPTQQKLCFKSNKFSLVCEFNWSKLVYSQGYSERLCINSFPKTCSWRTKHSDACPLNPVTPGDIFFEKSDWLSHIERPPFLVTPHKDFHTCDILSFKQRCSYSFSSTLLEKKGGMWEKQQFTGGF